MKKTFIIVLSILICCSFVFSKSLGKTTVTVGATLSADSSKLALNKAEFVVSGGTDKADYNVGFRYVPAGYVFSKTDYLNNEIEETGLFSKINVQALKWFIVSTEIGYRFVTLTADDKNAYKGIVFDESVREKGFYAKSAFAITPIKGLVFTPAVDMDIANGSLYLSGSAFSLAFARTSGTQTYNFLLRSCVDTEIDSNGKLYAVGGFTGGKLGVTFGSKVQYESNAYYYYAFNNCPALEGLNVSNGLAFNFSEFGPGSIFYIDEVNYSKLRASVSTWLPIKDGEFTDTFVTSNLGYDFSALNSRLNISGDVFFNRSFTDKDKNNTLLEIDAGFNDRNNDWNIYLGAKVSALFNKKNNKTNVANEDYTFILKTAYKGFDFSGLVDIERCDDNFVENNKVLMSLNAGYTFEKSLVRTIYLNNMRLFNRLDGEFYKVNGNKVSEFIDYTGTEVTTGNEL